MPTVTVVNVFEGVIHILVIFYSRLGPEGKISGLILGELWVRQKYL